MSLFEITSDPDFKRKADIAYANHSALLKTLIPFAVTAHIGSSAIVGALTKGDLDILALVSSEHELKIADQVLSQNFERNLGSDRNTEFASFKNDNLSPPLGIQLVLSGSNYDKFLEFRNRLTNSATLLKAFNELKLSFNGKSMEEYRRAKNKFIEEVLAQG